jgi:DNA-binding SARP family transcriptional activator
MLRLETFGAPALIDESGRPVVPQRRRLALLALLAVAGERGMSRDKVIACLWPESSTENARHALDQLLYFLRRQLPVSPVAGVDPLRLDGAVVRADVAEFSASLAAGDASTAVALYRGPFLDGFFVAGASEFERWAERERSRLAAEHARALRELAGQAEELGQRTAEIDYWRRLTESDPLSGRAAADLVRALAAVGDWAGASRAAREHAARVREELPGAPGIDLEGLVERLREERLAAGRPQPVAESGERYRIERELGRGSVATVYLARDRRFDRLVALKLLRPAVATATDARRFRREIAVLARLYHPHILQLYDSGVRDPGAGPAGLYYVMPYVRGESLRHRLQREVQLPVADAVALARDVAEALAYAHGQGVVHRDIRPENILLEAGHALVADFGIAGVLESAGGDKLSLSGVVLGMPGYMSPEQATGTRGVDGRSDLYSLGAVLYEMLAGEPPFTGATRQAVAARQATGQIPRLRTIRPDVPESLERVILTALAPRAEDRFSGAEAFAAALGGLGSVRVHSTETPH